ncbi:hypothetical protein [uncultured Albimonas sp.]|uniref:hypothetical protein n=1 Tax=uncultured Albimonas sp. TaxID=1331701 RepID=UPI0030EDAC67|tara:strand:- start:4446 stop:4970 length:525 start_codon:yes stop_codon:yes gene_type:complete
MDPERMHDAAATPIAIAWLDPEGRRTRLGEGRIDARGAIAVATSRPGMADYLAGLIDPLNARDEVAVKEPWPGEPGAISHRRVPRNAPEFLVELKAYALRALSLELDFDETAFASPLPAPLPLGSDDTPAPDAIRPLNAPSLDLDAYAEPEPEEGDGDDAPPLPPLVIPGLDEV